MEISGGPRRIRGAVRGAPNLEVAPGGPALEVAPGGVALEVAPAMEAPTMEAPVLEVADFIWSARGYGWLTSLWLAVQK